MKKWRELNVYVGVKIRSKVEESVETPIVSVMKHGSGHRHWRLPDAVKAPFFVYMRRLMIVRWS